MGGIMEDFIRVDVRDYVNKGIENGDLAPFWAIKYGRVRARRGNLGEIVNTYTDGGILEKENEVELDPVTGRTGWIITKCSPDGEVIVDEFGNKNEWIMDDSDFIQEYVLDNELEGVFKSVDGPQLFVQALADMTIVQGDEEMHVECGGYINITEFSNCYVISERDFNDTYRVMDTENPERTLN
jgi:hypothetical protein